MSQEGIIDIIGTHPEIPTEFIANVGTAVPIANQLEILGSVVTAGTNPLRTIGSGNTIDIQAQIAQAIASTNALNIGLAAFNSTDFSVDGNGFVSLLGPAASSGFTVDTFTAPGTNPVIPNGSGLITVTGGQVAAGSTTSVIRTNSLAANTYTIQIQRSQAVASSTVGDNGVSHFDSAAFGVDANGFVTNALGTGRFPITPYVVGPVGQAGYQTIQSAVNAANSAGGGVVYIQPGTYTENLTLFTNIVLWGSSEQTTFIIGTHTPPSSGILNIFRVFLQGAAAIFSSAAAGTTAFIMEDCAVNVTNGYTFDLLNWVSPGSVAVGNIGPFGTNDGFFRNTGGAGFFSFGAGLGNGTANSMTISGLMILLGGDIQCPVSFQTGSIFQADTAYFTASLTFANNSTGSINNCRISAGTAPAITMSSSGPLSIYHSTIQSTNVPAIAGSGAGVLTYADLTFINNATFAGTLTLATAAWRPYSQALAAGDGTKVGTCNFDSASFAVSSTGFVTLLGGGEAIDSVAVQTGTSPIVPTAGGLITINGAVVAAGTNPVRSDGTGANTLAIEVQTSQALSASDATKIGLSNFDSASFAVSATGFVSMAGGGGFTWTDQSGTFTAAKNTGYFITGTATANLPAAPAQGDTIKFVVDHASQVLTIDAPGTQIIRLGSTVTAAGGTAVSTARGDSIELTYRSSNTCWFATATIGSWNIT